MFSSRDNGSISSTKSTIMTIYCNTIFSLQMICDKLLQLSLFPNPFFIALKFLPDIELVTVTLFLVSTKHKARDLSKVVQIS